MGELDLGLIDVLDIGLVTALLYQLLQMLRGSRAMAVLFGLGLLMALYLLAAQLGLSTVIWLLQHVFSSFFILIVVIFQTDIRRALGEMGTARLFRRKTPHAALVDETLTACKEMARNRVGALIVLERSMHLGDVVKRDGVTLNAQLSGRLLRNIFHPGAPLHDGAVILRNGKILAAACILPLAVAEGQHFGTRHRAGMGVTEQSDAVAIVISEERGEISVAERGKLRRSLTPKELREVLDANL
ncbi:MAG: diadenylate cyclase CdaA [Desulfovibrio sp.]|jgi:uncharacterized protein (TIGR00159 family)|nr:diadenylate cyclase CdaA [Desulfovibrio sp.]